MLLNGKEVSVEELMQDVSFTNNTHQKLNNNLDLTNYQVEVLGRFGIDCQSLGSLKEIIYLGEEALSETDDEELEIILAEIAERDYYENTNK